MQKALEQMNVQLHKTVSDISGVTGISIIRKIVSGERDPLKLAQLRQKGVQRSTAEIAEALTGHYREEHVFSLGQALEAYDFFQGQMECCDQAIKSCMAKLPTVPRRDGGSTMSTSNRRRRKNEPHFDLATELCRISGVDVTIIPGLKALLGQRTITECGTDMARFPSEKHFSSWLNICPDNRKTGGVIRSTRTRRGKNPAATAFCIAAQSVLRSKSALGARARRLRARLGAPKAITAIAHYLAKLYYRLMRYGQPYVERGLEAYEANYRTQAINKLNRRAAALGIKLVDTATGEILEAGVS
jgi:transposase